MLQPSELQEQFHWKRSVCHVKGTSKLEGGGKRGSTVCQQGYLRAETSESPMPDSARESFSSKTFLPCRARERVSLPGLRTHCRLQWIEEDGDLMLEYQGETR